MTVDLIMKALNDCVVASFTMHKCHPNDKEVKGAYFALSTFRSALLGIMAEDAQSDASPCVTTKARITE
jgi:hypothetical protein